MMNYFYLKKITGRFCCRFNSVVTQFHRVFRIPEKKQERKKSLLYIQARLMVDQKIYKYLLFTERLQHYLFVFSTIPYTGTLLRQGVRCWSIRRVMTAAKLLNIQPSTRNILWQAYTRNDKHRRGTGGHSGGYYRGKTKGYAGVF